MKVVLKDKAWLVVLIAVLILTIVAIQYGIFPKGGIADKSSIGVNRMIFYDRNSFFKGVAWAETNTPKDNIKIKVGVIPHHLFASFIFSDFFLRLKTNPPKTVILVGPNHYERGDFKVLTSDNGWQTPFGVVYPDNQIINQLIESSLVRTDDQVLTEDHAVSGSMPYMKYYLPATKVVPLLISGTLTIKETRDLADSLINSLNEDTIIVAPVDFSHYLNSEEAQEKDKVTLSIMRDFNYEKLYSLNNDYLDSPPSIGLILMLSQKLGYKNLAILQHTNSGLLQNKNNIKTTSYFSFYTY